MTNRQFLSSVEALGSGRTDGWPPEARDAVAAALYASSTEGAGNMMTWPEFRAHHGQNYEGVARFYRRADAAIAAITPLLATARADGMREAAEIAHEAWQDGVPPAEISAVILARAGANKP